MELIPLTSRLLTQEMGTRHLSLMLLNSVEFDTVHMNGSKAKTRTERTDRQTDDMIIKYLPVKGYANLI